MLFQCLPESLLDRQVRFWLVLSLKTLAFRRSCGLGPVDRFNRSRRRTCGWLLRGSFLITLSALLCASFVPLLETKRFLPKAGFGWVHGSGARWKIERTSCSVSAAAQWVLLVEGYRPFHWLSGRLRTPKSSACRSSPFGSSGNLRKCNSEFCQLIQCRAHNQANHVLLFC